MKKALLFCAVAFGVLFAACTKENEETATPGDQTETSTRKHIAKITVVGGDYRPESKMSIKFNWDGDKLNHVYFNKKGELWYDLSVMYNGTTPQRFEMSDFNQGRHINYDLVYDAGRVAYVVANGERGAVQYDGDKPSRITTDGSPWSIVWSDGNIIAIRRYDRNINYSATDFDSHINPLNEVMAILFPGSSQNMHNPIRAGWQGTNVSLSYEYTGEYPSTASFYTNDEGSIKIYFEYTDGTGTRAPVLDKYVPKRAKRAGLEILPDFITR